jgi:hypothetical protein
VELVGIFNADGSVQLASSINGVDVLAAASGALADSGAFNNTTLRVNDRTAGSNGGFMALREIKIIAGVQTLATMRAAVLRPNSASFADDALTKGGTLRVYDQDLGVQTTQRLLEFTRDYTKPGDVTFRVGARERTLGEILRPTTAPVTDAIGALIRAAAAGLADAVEAGAVLAGDGFIDIPTYDSTGAPTGDTFTIDGSSVTTAIAKSLRTSFKTKL